jgi:hypothetical protein
LRANQLKVTSLSEVKTIIDIFSTYPLNSNKHLYFLAFREAYELYTLPQNKPRDEIIQEIRGVPTSGLKIL